MSKTYITPRSATIAIAVILALGTTPGMAQTQPPAASPAVAPPASPAEPVLAGPPPAAPIPAAPTPTTQAAPANPIPTTNAPATTPIINLQPRTSAPATTTVIPPQPQRTAISNPIVQTAPAPQQETDAPAAEVSPVVAGETTRPQNTRSAAAASLPPASAAPATLASAPQNSPTLPETSDATLLSNGTASDLTTEPAATAPAFIAPASAANAVAPEAGSVANGSIEPTVASDNSILIALATGGLALLAGLGAIVFALRQRKVAPTRDRIVKKSLVEPRPQAEPQFAENGNITVPVAELKATPAPIMADCSSARVTSISRPVPQQNVRGDGLPHAGASVALPTKAPATLRGRADLIKRMVAAEPDRANPFTTSKARRKRARLIVQSLGRKFPGTSQIDFSQYPHNFPELAEQQKIAA